MEGKNRGRGKGGEKNTNSHTPESKNQCDTSGAHTSGLPKDSSPGAAVCVEKESGVNLQKDVLHSIMSFMNEVSISPGKYDKHIGTLLRDFNTWAKSKNITGEVSKMVIEKSLTCQNFRYSGARFCTTLLKKSKDMGESTFWDSMQNGLDTEKMLAIVAQQRDYNRIRGLLMFLAELFVQLDEERAILGTDICFLIGILIQEPENGENIRNVCQALKLSGRYLDVTHNESMEQIFINLDMMLGNPNCARTAFNQVSSLCTYRESNWGENAIVPSPDPPKPPKATDVVSETIYCGADGTDLSVEESRFLEQNLAEPEADDFKYFQELWEAEDPMNELDDAFEEFLRFSKQE